MKTSDIKGIIPPVITPMNNDPEQTVNHQALREQVERLLAGGVHGIFPMGTNGEAYALSFQEKEEILATVIDQVKGRVPVYAGTGCITTAETIRLSKRAEELGADALSIITPQLCTGLPEGAVRPLHRRGKGRQPAHHPVQHPRPHRQQAAARDRAGSVP